tara:strand:- start:1120 stop:1470 length:351 start_codon:yes stop_codon:yes gene_type:complete
MSDLNLLKLLLPEYLVDYFDVIRHESQEEQLHLYFEEKNKPPVEYSKNSLSSKGFHQEITIQDFPIRGQHAYLHIKRRRWMNHDTGMVVSRNWNLIANGTRMTAEFAAFLKEIGQV